MASIAQEESRKISERVKWSLKRNMEKGVVIGSGRIYGYRLVDGKLVIVPEEAEVVREIFSSYFYDGKGSTLIARELNDKGIPTLKDKLWSSQLILKMIANEKYVGDLTQWKCYKPNVLSEKPKVNHGEDPDVPLITVKDHHEAIISRELWDAVQKGTAPLAVALVQRAVLLRQVRLRLQRAGADLPQLQEPSKVRQSEAHRDERQDFRLR